jgi:hypothetical protein
MPSGVTSVRAPVAPPEEQFWQRYSPHHEFPLSTISSIAIHAFVLLMLFLLGKLLFEILQNPSPPLREFPIIVGDGGGRGAPDGGDQRGPGIPGNDGQVEDRGNAKKTEPAAGPEPRPRLDPNTIPIIPLTPKEPGDPLLEPARRAVEESKRINDETKRRLRKALGSGSKDKGLGGSDKGNDTGVGKDPGPGTGELRRERMDRWEMVFDTYSGEDYARQLAGLGAILAIPRGTADEYDIIYDLSKRPVQLKRDDIGSIHRIWWEDRKRDSIAPLCSALGITPVPGHIVAFFPEELERKLLKIELQYNGLREEQIKETRFKIRKTAGGYEPVVVEQRRK